MHAVPGFIDDTLKKVKEKYGLKEEDITAHVASYSMGTANGMTAIACLLIRGMDCDTMTATEPFGMKLAYDRIMEDLRKNGPLTHNIRRFPAPGFNNAVETLLDHNQNSRHYHAYRVQENRKGKTKTTVVSKLGGAGNQTLDRETIINMDDYENATKRLLIYLDPLHLNGTIMLQLIKENTKAVAAAKIESSRNVDPSPENSPPDAPPPEPPAFSHLKAARKTDENPGEGKQHGSRR